MAKTVKNKRTTFVKADGKSLFCLQSWIRWKDMTSLKILSDWLFSNPLCDLADVDNQNLFSGFYQWLKKHLSIVEKFVR